MKTVSTDSFRTVFLSRWGQNCSRTVSDIITVANIVVTATNYTVHLEMKIHPICSKCMLLWTIHPCKFLFLYSFVYFLLTVICNQNVNSSFEMTDVFSFNYLVHLNAVPFLQSTASYILYRNMCMVKDRVIIKTVFVYNLEIPWHVLTATLRWFDSLWKDGCYASNHYTIRFICTIHLWATVCGLLS